MTGTGYATLAGGRGGQALSAPGSPHPSKSPQDPYEGHTVTMPMLQIQKLKSKEVRCPRQYQARSSLKCLIPERQLCHSLPFSGSPRSPGSAASRA